MTAQLEWIAPDGESVRLRETRTISTDAHRCRRVRDRLERATHRRRRHRARPHPVHHLGWLRRAHVPRRPDWTDTVIRLDDGVERDRTLGEPSTWLAIDGLDERGSELASWCSTIPANLRSPSPWYASTRADTYGEGWANFVNAAFLWDEPFTLAAGRTARPSVPRDRARRRVVDRTHPIRVRELGAVITTSHALGDELLGFVTDTVAALQTHHFPEWQIPRTFAGHRVDPDVRADLLYTLHHLAAGGVTTIAARPIDDAIATLLTRVNGRDTHTFFSYRIAETLSRAGAFADNPLLEPMHRRAARPGWPRNRQPGLDRAARHRHPSPQLRGGVVSVRVRPSTARAQRRPRRARPTHRTARRTPRSEPAPVPRRLERRVRPLRHLHRGHLALLRTARGAARTTVGRRRPRRARPRRHRRRPGWCGDPLGSVHRRPRDRAHGGARRAGPAAEPAHRPRRSVGSARRRCLPRHPHAIRSRRRDRRAPVPQSGRVPRPVPPPAAHPRRARQARLGRCRASSS